MSVENETDRSDTAIEEENGEAGAFENTKDSTEVKSSDVSHKSPEKKISISQKVKRLWKKIRDIWKKVKRAFSAKQTGIYKIKTVGCKAFPSASSQKVPATVEIFHRFPRYDRAVAWCDCNVSNRISEWMECCSRFYSGCILCGCRV